MSNDWEKDLDAFLDKVPGLPATPEKKYAQQNQGDSRNREIDATEMLMQKLMQRGMVQQNPASANIEIPTNSPERIEIREGTEYYTNVPAEMSKFPIAMKAGVIENTIGKDFVFKGFKNILLIESHQSIDLSNVDQSQLKRMCLVEGMWVGTIVVPESAVVRVGQNSGSKILKG